MGLRTLEQMKAMWESTVPHEKEGRIHKPEPSGEHLSAEFRRVEYFGGPQVAQRFVLAYLMAGANYWHAHNASNTHSIVDTFLALKTPMMLMTNPGEMLRSLTEDAARRKPDARLVTLKTEGGMATDTDPEEFVSEVMGFLREP